MDVGVKWIYQQARLPGGGKIEAGQKPALCLRGRVHMLCVAAGHPVRALKRPAADFPKMRDVVKYDSANMPLWLCPVTEAVETLRGIGKRCGITRAAEQLLNRALRCSVGAEDATIDDEEAFEDEEALLIEPTDKLQENEMSTEQPAAEAATNGAGPATGRSRAKLAKSAKRASGAKTAGRKAKTSAKAKAAKGDGLGRPGTATRFICERLMRGQTNETISAAAQKEFPDAKSTEAKHVAWYRARLVKAGQLKKS